MFPEQNNDIIDVRPDEQLDTAALAAYLRDKLPHADKPLTMRQFGGGAANLTYLLDFDGHHYVLRRPPLGPVAPSAHDMGREYKVLSVLHQVLPYAPQAYLFCDDEAVIGAPFFVMEQRHGVVVRRAIPAVFANVPNATRKMSEALVDALADFHAVDYAAIGLTDLGKPDGFIERQVEGWNRRWHRAKEYDLEQMDSMYDWLKANLPHSSEATLIHNDYKLDNTMLATDDPGQLVAIFDWDMCTLGDPLSDLGALLGYWTEMDDPPYMQMTATMPVGVPGFMTRRELVERYAKRSGRDVSNIHYYHALSLYRLVVIIAQIYIRYVKGQTKDERFASLGQMIPLLAQAACDVAEGKLGV